MAIGEGLKSNQAGFRHHKSFFNQLSSNMRGTSPWPDPWTAKGVDRPSQSNVAQHETNFLF